MTDATNTEPGPAQTPAPDKGDGRKWHEKKRVLLPLVAAVAFFLGMGAGGSAPEPEQAADEQQAPPPAPAEDDGAAGDESAAEIEELQGERDTLQAQLAEQTSQIEQLQRQLRRARRAAATAQEPEDEPAPQGAGGTYTAGDYQFADVQVGEDSLGDFTMRARVTNNGSDRGGVIWKATIFSGGSVVGTLDGTASDFAAGQTITVEFVSTDDFADWDEIEFQVDTEF
ncbi:MAG TPA: hypothetical protein VNT52_09330 [Acidimicrobiales bacterium]|nr:hypothetical protein [Egibacteraceae bacterium]HWI04012.1 hypothetical protein [Acidimicrobiales bacterium]